MARIISLSSPSDFDRVLRRGRRGSSGVLTCAVAARVPETPPEPLAGAVPAEPGPRIGLTVPKRIGGAVVRNRAKRRLREAIRALDRALPADHDVVILARPGIDGRDFQQLRADLAAALTKAGVEW